MKVVSELFLRNENDMGRFYTNVTVRHNDAENVARAVAPLSRDAVIAPFVDGFVVVYD